MSILHTALQFQSDFFCLLLQLIVFLFPSVEEFEERLCKSVNEDRLAKAGIFRN